MGFNRLRSRFRPNTRIDIFDAYQEQRTGTPQKVAEVQTDGKKGQIAILDQQFAEVIKDAFEKPQHIFQQGVHDARQGISFDVTPRSLPAWSPEAIEHVVGNEFKLHQLRAEISKK